MLFKPEYGVFHMAIGSDIISAYAGAADHDSFVDLHEVSKVKTIKTNRLPQHSELEEQYAMVRQLRVNQANSDDELSVIWALVRAQYPNEWLLILEMYEIANDNALKAALNKALKAISATNKQVQGLISEGLAILEGVLSAHRSADGA